MTALYIILGGVLVLAIIVVIATLARSRKEKPDTSYQEALQLLLDGKEVEAAKKLRDVLVADTDNVDAYIRLGRLVREKGNAEKAANIHQSLTVRPGLKRSEELVIYAELIEDYLQMDRIEKAIGLLKELLRISPEKPKVLQRLLSLLADLRRASEAAEILGANEKILKDKEVRSLWYAEIARLFWKKGESQSAAEMLKRAQKLARRHPYITIIQIENLVNSEQYSKARQMFERFIKNYPQYAGKLLDLVEKTYFELGTYEKVGPLYANLLNRDPDNRDIRLRLINFKLKEGAFNEALALIDEVLVSTPTDVGFLIEKINLLFTEKRYKDAEDIFASLSEQLIFMPAICAECGEPVDSTAWICSSCGCQVCD